MFQSLNQKVGVKGEITAKAYDQTKLNKFQKRINLFLRGLFAANLISKERMLNLYHFGPLKFVDEHKNVICNDGFNVFTKRMVGDNTYTGLINKALLGTGVTGSASPDDHQLETEAYRNDVASGSESSNIAYLTCFFTEAECSGTFKEFGNCIDGTASANTGRLWSHLKGLNWAKDTNTALVISCKYTFASV